MNDRVVIVANGMTHENVRLQPWRYLYEIAMRIAERHETVLITEGDQCREEEDWGNGLNVIRTCWLSVRQQDKLRSLIVALSPKQLWWSVTPRTVAYWRMLRRIECDKVALITCPLYEYRQLIRASLAGVPFEELGALWKQRLIPRALFARMLGGGLFRKVYVQSEANRKVLLQAGLVEKLVSLLRVGIDKEDREPVSTQVINAVHGGMGGGSGVVRLLYFGAVRKIRGFDALLNAFARTAASASEAHLVVLARGADEAKLREVRERVATLGLSERVSLIGGWLSRQQIWAYIEACDIAVLPFVIVPSDVPIAILEAMARGKPVIGTPIDGIPELVEGRGLVVDPLDVPVFANGMVSLCRDKEWRNGLGDSAMTFMQSYPDWDKIGAEAMLEAGLT